MSMKVSAPDGVKVYNVGVGKTMPSWLSEAKKRALRKDDEFRRRLEVLQDLQFPNACQRIKITPDGQYVFATGYHPPMVKLYDLANLSLKFDRHLDAEVVDFTCLSDDYSKVAFLCADRSVAFHARFGSYFKTRTPRQGRDLAYSPHSAELLVVGSAAEVYRINLEEGRFMNPLSSSSSAINACGISPTHGLFATAGEDGQLECWDLRSRKAVAAVDAAAAAGAAGAGLTALRFDPGGLQLAAGTSTGLVGLWDLRQRAPLLVKDHMYGEAIRDIKFHSGGVGVGGAGSVLDVKRIVSSDKHIVKIWDAVSGAAYTSIEPPEGADINDVCIWPGSGLMLLGLDASRVGSYFVPSLGPAPRWASFLEGLTEELEEATPSLYDDYRFVTRTDLNRLGLDHLLGTPLLRAYMHGFFMDARLYSKAAAAAQPHAYEAWRAAKVAQKMEEERQGRISVARKLPKVNPAVAARLMAQQQLAPDAAAEAAAADTASTKRRAAAAAEAAAAASTLLSDDRFKLMFEDADFAVDEGSHEYKMLHPNAAAGAAGGSSRKGRSAADDEEDEDEGGGGKDSLLKEHFKKIMEEGVSEEDEESGDDVMSDDGGSDVISDDGGDSGDEGAGRQPQQQQQQQRKVKGHWQQLKRVQADTQQAKPAKRSKGPSMYVAKDATSAAAFQRGESLSAVLAQPLEARVTAAAGAAGGRRGGGRGGFVGGSRELTFTPSSGGGRGRGRGGRGRGGGRGGGGRGRGRGR